MEMDANLIHFPHPELFKAKTACKSQAVFQVILLNRPAGEKAYAFAAFLGAASTTSTSPSAKLLVLTPA